MKPSDRIHFDGDYQKTCVGGFCTLMVYFALLYVGYINAVSIWNGKFIITNLKSNYEYYTSNSNGV